ncbi:MAG: L,D-transpeptidase [Leptolyngbyaceae cyanobacterium bins.302]|nr:L,D-transpeptidase [Leptolyngbyaceae cyanobacterium bins.302]
MKAMTGLNRSCLNLLLGVGMWFGAGELEFQQGQAQPQLVAQYTTAMTNLKLSGQRWIEIDLSSQRLYAWEGDRPVYAILISTGKAATPTPTGKFAIQSRHRYARMQGYDYDVPDVPYTMYYSGGYAIHGAYWHHRFGTPVSHGCTNVAVNHARWLFNWATIGTPVVVHD